MTFKWTLERGVSGISLRKVWGYGVMWNVHTHTLVHEREREIEIDFNSVLVFLRGLQGLKISL